MTTTKFDLSDWVDEAITDLNGRDVIKNWLIYEGFETSLALSELDPLTIPEEILNVKIKNGWLKALSASIKIIKNKIIISSSGIIILITLLYYCYCRKSLPNKEGTRFFIKLSSFQWY